MRERALWLVLIAAIVMAWGLSLPEVAPVGQWTAAVPSKVLADVPKVEIAPKKLKVYAPQAKKKLKLPDALQQDDNQFVIASSTLKHDYRPQTVTTVINSATGGSTTITRRGAYPWFAAQQTGEIRIDYGIKNGLERVGRLTVREDFIQVKGANLGATATLDTDGSAFIGAGVGYKW